MFDPPQRASTRHRVALQGEAGRLASTARGACRVDQVAIALDPRALPGAGPETCVRVDLDAAGLVVHRIDTMTLPLDVDGEVDGAVVLAVERLTPLPDDAGYLEPTFQTAGDRERKTDRDGLRRTA